MPLEERARLREELAAARTLRFSHTNSAVPLFYLPEEERKRLSALLGTPQTNQVAPAWAGFLSSFYHSNPAIPFLYMPEEERYNLKGVQSLQPLHSKAAELAERSASFSRITASMYHSNPAIPFLYLPEEELQRLKHGRSDEQTTSSTTRAELVNPAADVTSRACVKAQVMRRAGDIAGSSREHAFTPTPGQSATSLFSRSARDDVTETSSTT